MQPSARQTLIAAFTNYQNRLSQAAEHVRAQLRTDRMKAIHNERQNRIAIERTRTERGRVPRATLKNGQPARPIERRKRSGRVQTVRHYGSTWPNILTRGGFYIVRDDHGLNRRGRLSLRTRAERCGATRRAEPRKAITA